MNLCYLIQKEMYCGIANGTAKSWKLFILLNIHNIEKYFK
jgi:hypothetical protein